MWRTSAAALSIVIVIFIAMDFVYGQSRKLSEPVTVIPVNGRIEIPAAQVSDGRLHRFVVADSGVRFIIMKTDKLHVAFDACEICGSQGYVEETGALICLNCAADINPATIGAGGGCNPIPLASEMGAESVVIRESDVRANQSLFHTGQAHVHQQ